MLAAPMSQLYSFQILLDALRTRVVCSMGYAPMVLSRRRFEEAHKWEEAIDEHCGSS